MPVPKEPAGLTAQLDDHTPAVAALCRRLRVAALTALPDPYGLLTGTGRRTRTLVFSPGPGGPTDAHLVEYLDLALDRALARHTGRPAR